jgi:hypothetical protein
VIFVVPVTAWIIASRSGLSEFSASVKESADRYGATVILGVLRGEEFEPRLTVKGRSQEDGK